jgi:hypothetical protein
MIAPRVRVRVRRRCDDECPSMWDHPIAAGLAVAAATVAFQVIGEVVVKRLTASEPEPEQPAPPPRKRGGGA